MQVSESDSMAVASFLHVFHHVPPHTLPPLFDCLLASASLTPSSLFHSLISHFQAFSEGIIYGNENLNSDQYGYFCSFFGAICHLLKKPWATTVEMQVFIYKCYIPSLKLIHTSDTKVIYQVRESFHDLLLQTNYWSVLEETLVPIFTIFLRHSLGIFDDSECGTEHTSEIMGDLAFGHFSLAFSCYVLTSILDVAVPSCKAAKITPEVTLSNGFCYAENFTKNLLRDLCGVAIQMVSGSIEHRSHVIKSLLPSILKAFASHGMFDISRNHFLKKLWTCCQKLFSMGSMERRDAYNILSLYFSHLGFTCCGRSISHTDKEKFDLRCETGFLDEIRKGLVNKESLVRKQCLHILKKILQINEGHNDTCFSISDKEHGNDFIRTAMSKRAHWADKEAKSLGVGKKTYNYIGDSLSGRQRWNGFILLYEMLEEYGTHLVESAWEHQVDSFLLFSSKSDDSEKITGNTDYFHDQMNNFKGICIWLVILLERGLFHDNPQVRCLIMKSFLGVNWNSHANSAKMIPENFILGPFLFGLNDTVHHKDFGGKGVFSSNIIDGASRFIHQYASNLSWRDGIEFLIKMTSVSKVRSFGRPGLMCLARCIFSAAGGIQPPNFNKNIYCDHCEENSMEGNCDCDSVSHNLRTMVLDNLRLLVESSKQHFNPVYRLRVCESILETAAILVYVDGLSPGTLMHFIYTFPREFTEYGGVLRAKIQNWIFGSSMNCHSEVSHPKSQIMAYIYIFPTSFINDQLPTSPHIVTCDDEELTALVAEAKRWSHLFFLAVNADDDLEPFFRLIRNHFHDITEGRDVHCGRKPIKFLLLFSAMIQELQIMWQKVKSFKVNSINEDIGVSSGVHVLLEKFSEFFVSIMEMLLSFAVFSHSLLMSKYTECDEDLPPSVRGRLGGPSQRRLSSNMTCLVLQAVTSIKVIASSVSWINVFKPDIHFESVFTFLFNFFLDIISRNPCDSKAASEVALAEYEALTDVLKTLSSSPPFDVACFIRKSYQPRHPVVEGKHFLDGLLLCFLKGVSCLISSGHLTKSRCAVLLKAKWLCVESLLTISTYTFSDNDTLLLTEATVCLIFEDLIESLEIAGEDSILTLLGSVRLILNLYGSGNLYFSGNSCRAIDTQMIWKLVRSSWVMHANWSKRRVTYISALLSAVFHDSLFGDIGMHVCGDDPGPLKWFAENILTEGIKSPRIMRLAALHLTKFWLCNPKVLKHYVVELKLLSLHGSVAVDEDIEAELPDRTNIQSEISDSELTNVFMNTELYARVTVAVLFYKLANVLDTAKSKGETLCCYVLEAGKLFLMNLLESVVNDKDLSKELYKKYCSIHRRKVRAWQMMCVLSRFIDDEVVEKVRYGIHICIQRNNMPSVRQYLEIFAVHMYLKFPMLVKELVAIFLDNKIKPQALSSYVFIAANVILHSKETVRYKHFDDLLPAIIPLLTSHHHSLRGFTQLLVHQVLYTFYPHSNSCESASLENRCLQGIMDYLENNPDCMRLRTSMKRYLDEFDPSSFSTPFGIFTKHIEEQDFECVPISLMDRVLNFLNDVRDDLRSSMARDLISITDEDRENSHDDYTSFIREEESLNFQKKFTVPTPESYQQFLEFEKEDDLFEHLYRSRNIVVESVRESRQPFIVVASLLDRIPNLAGLTRTCEIFKAAGLAIADTKILRDKQYQLISVTAEKWVPIIEVAPNRLKDFLEKKRGEGFCLVGLEQTAKSIPLHRYTFPRKMVLVLGGEREGIRVDIIHGLDECIEIPQLGVVRALNVHVSAAIAVWEYTRQHAPLP